jgi:hypothetical protein
MSTRYMDYGVHECVSISLKVIIIYKFHLDSILLNYALHALRVCCVCSLCYLYDEKPVGFWFIFIYFCFSFGVSASCLLALTSALHPCR